MPKAILGKKIGMARVFDADGVNVPVTVVQAGPCVVSQIKTEAPRNNGKCDGYDALQLAYDDVKARNSTIPVIGHDHRAGTGPKRFHREVRMQSDELAGYELGQTITVDAMAGVKFVDVVGTSKGKGTAGVMKRHGFKGMSASHGTERKHRHPGSVSGRSSNLGTGKPKKGIRKMGRMGDERVTVRSAEVISIDSEQGLIVVKGPMPGPNGGLVLLQEAKRLYKGKAVAAEAAKKAAEAS